MGNIQTVGKSSAPMYRGEKPLETLLAPSFALSDVAVHAVDFWLSTEDLPLPENRVTIVLDVNCKAHEPDNLYVVDTSFFPSIGAVNPSLTAAPNALRVGDHPIGRLG